MYNANIRMNTNYTNERRRRYCKIIMNTTDTNGKEKLIYPELSYKIVGILYQVHNQLGRFAREKQYCDLIEKLLIDLKIPYIREYVFSDSGNRVDFIIDE